MRLFFSIGKSHEAEEGEDGACYATLAGKTCCKFKERGDSRAKLSWPLSEPTRLLRQGLVDAARRKTKMPVAAEA